MNYGFILLTLGLQVQVNGLTVLALGLQVQVNGFFSSFAPSRMTLLGSLRTFKYKRAGHIPNFRPCVSKDRKFGKYFTLSLRVLPRGKDSLPSLLGKDDEAISD